MDAILEIFMEILGTAIIEGGVSAASSRRRPVWQRVLILAVLGLFSAAVFAIILLVGIGAFRDFPLVALFLFALDAVWVFLGIRRLHKILHTFSRK